MIVADSDQERDKAISDILNSYSSGGTRPTALAKLIMLGVQANEAAGLLDEIDDLWSRVATC